MASPRVVALRCSPSCQTRPAASVALAIVAVLADAWADTTTPHGRLMLTVLGGLAEFERELIRSRTGEGRARARTRGVHMGRPPKLTFHQKREALNALADGSTSPGLQRRPFYEWVSRVARQSIGKASGARSGSIDDAFLISADLAGEAAGDPAANETDRLASIAPCAPFAAPDRLPVDYEGSDLLQRCFQNAVCGSRGRCFSA